MAPERGIFVVADGMGGHAAGEVASRLAADTTIDILQGWRLDSEAAIESALRTTFSEAHRRIVTCCEGDPATAGMGTTLTIAVLLPSGTLHLGHLGDSRVYLRSPGKPLQQLTHDHTWVQQEVDAGRLSPEEARTHPLSHILTKVLTAGEPPDPDLLVYPIRPGDRLLLCSDGLYNMVDEEILEQLLGADEPLPRIVEALVSTANQRGGADNITAIVVGTYPAGDRAGLAGGSS